MLKLLFNTNNPENRGIDWVPTLFLSVLPVVAVALTAAYVYLDGLSWGMVALFVVFYSLTAMSITAGYHRLWSHKTYEASKLLQWFLALFGAAAFQNSIYKWSVDHRLHHRYVDGEKDPYSISKGFWFAHMGWMCRKQDWPTEARAYGRDLEKDPIVMFQHRHYLPIAIVMGFFLPTLIGWMMGSALGGLAIGACLRIVALHHGTFLINSACHWWGKQPYTTENTARDNLMLAFLTFGEGYHNFHHLFATDYRNGIRWYHWDPTKWAIEINAKLGMAFNLKKTNEQLILKARIQKERSRVEALIPTYKQQWRQRMDQLSTNLENAQKRFLELKAEYRELKRQRQEASQQKLLEIRAELKLAKLQFQASLRQWGQFQSNLSKLAPTFA